MSVRAKKTTAPNNLATIRVLQKHFILPPMLSEGDVEGGGGGEGGGGQPEVKVSISMLCPSVSHIPASCLGLVMIMINSA